MKDFRKAQMKLAVLLEIGAVPKKNGSIIKDAEKRLVLDDAYNRLMKNGRQTIGSKEMQFILYYIKKDGVADLPVRGMYKENEKTALERNGLIAAVLNEVGKNKAEDIQVILNADTLAHIEMLFKDIKPQVEPTSRAEENGGEKKAAEVKRVERKAKREKPIKSKKPGKGAPKEVTQALSADDAADKNNGNDINDIFLKADIDV